MAKTAIVTLAGSSSRFSKSIGYECHKSLYHDEKSSWTILSHHINLLCESGFDDIILIGGYKFEDVSAYIKQNFPDRPIRLFCNPHYADWGSCYSLVMGIQQVKEDCESLVFLEGDLIFDTDNFKKLINLSGNAITANKMLIDARTAVAFYISESGQLKYVYDTKHQKLSVNESFTKIGNSGQVWKFSDINKLKQVISQYKEPEFKQTNLKPIGDYYADVDCNDIPVVAFDVWFNCNTVTDYHLMKKYIER